MMANPRGLIGITHDDIPKYPLFIRAIFCVTPERDIKEYRLSIEEVPGCGPYTRTWSRQLGSAEEGSLLDEEHPAFYESERFLIKGFAGVDGQGEKGDS